MQRTGHEKKALRFLRAVFAFHPQNKPELLHNDELEKRMLAWEQEQKKKEKQVRVEPAHVLVEEQQSEHEHWQVVRQHGDRDQVNLNVRIWRQLWGEHGVWRELISDSWTKPVVIPPVWEDEEKFESFLNSLRDLEDRRQELRMDQLRDQPEWRQRAWDELTRMRTYSLKGGHPKHWKDSEMEEELAKREEWWKHSEKWRETEGQKGIDAVKELKVSIVNLLVELEKLDGSSSARGYDIFHRFALVDPIEEYFDAMGDAMDYGDPEQLMVYCIKAFDFVSERLRSDEVKQGVSDNFFSPVQV